VPQGRRIVDSKAKPVSWWVDQIQKRKWEVKKQDKEGLWKQQKKSLSRSSSKNDFHYVYEASNKKSLLTFFGNMDIRERREGEKHEQSKRYRQFKMQNRSINLSS